MQSLFFTCEHATNFIPQHYKSLFPPSRRARGPWGRKKIQDLLRDHWAYDLGALAVAKRLQVGLSAPLHIFPVSRLLIEGNRYRRPKLFSALTRHLSAFEKEKIQRIYWIPHTRKIQEVIQDIVRTRRCAVHIGVHTFTPSLRGIERQCDVGILFDSRRTKERSFAHRLEKKLKALIPMYRIRRNYPYTGTAEGLTTYFRKQFSDKKYIGIEIEINNKHVRRLTASGKVIIHALASVLK